MRRIAIRSLMSTGLILAGNTAFAQADMVLLQQSLPGDAAGNPFLLVDRSRISHVTVTKEASLAHHLTIHLATEPPVEIELTCNDEAITRQVLDALRRGALTTLDLTGRCRL